MSNTQPTKAKVRSRTLVDEDRRYPARPLIGIGIVIWRGEQVLLIRRGKPPRQGEWGLPGGAQHVGETIVESARREAREETGLEVQPLGIVTALDAITRDAAGEVEYHYTVIDVAAESSSGEAKAASDALEVRWATVIEVEQLCAWPEVVRIVRLSALQRVL